MTKITELDKDANKKLTNSEELESFWYTPSQKPSRIGHRAQPEPSRSVSPTLSHEPAAARAVQSNALTNTQPVFKSMSMAELLLDRPSKTWLIDSVFGQHDTVIVCGPSGVGKTFVVIDLILAACTGSQWAKKFAVTRPLNVAYCAGEGIDGLAGRFKAATDHHKLPGDSLPNFYFFPKVPQLYEDKSKESMSHFVEEWKAHNQSMPLDLLVIDTMHAATVGADENASKDMGKILQMVDYAKKELGCGVLLVHHTNKAGLVERGSGSLRGAVDTLIMVKKVGSNSTSGKGVMECEKLRDKATWSPHTFSLIPTGNSIYVHWDEPTEQRRVTDKQNQDRESLLKMMQDNPGTLFTVKQLGEKTGITGNAIYALLNSMVEKGECQTELTNPAKGTSSRNQSLYFVSDRETVAESQPGKHLSK